MTAPGTPETIRRTQTRKLRVLLSALAERNPFYQPRILAANLDPATCTTADFVTAFPFTTRDEWTRDQLDHPPYGTNFTFSAESYTRLCRTSGTAGRAMNWLDTPESWSAMLDQWDRVYIAAGVEAGTGIFFAFSFGPFLGFWTAFEAASRRGCLCVPGGGLSTPARLDLLVETASTVLCCTPTYAARLAETARLEGRERDLSSVEKIIVAGESGGSVPAVRSRLSDAWGGARIYDHHGMTEVGPVSYPCPHTEDRLHVMEESYLAEVVASAGAEAAAEGEAGELVLTTLDRMGSPLLRYRTGDRVVSQRHAPCDCGAFDLSLEGGIRGRDDDMVTVRGVNVFPSAVDSVVQRSDPVEEYETVRRTVNGMDELIVRIEFNEGTGDAEAERARLAEAFERALGLRVGIEIVDAGSLPRYQFKAQRWKVARPE
jgi:phenylacetate-CoA ligase